MRQSAHKRSKLESQTDARAAVHHHWCEAGIAEGAAPAPRNGARRCGRAAGAAGSRSEVMMMSLSTPLRSIGVKALAFRQVWNETTP